MVQQKENSIIARGKDISKESFSVIFVATSVTFGLIELFMRLGRVRIATDYCYEFITSVLGWKQIIIKRGIGICLIQG